MNASKSRWTLTAIAASALLALTACQPHDFPQYPANYREYAYVTNGGSSTVTVLDVVNVRLDRELPVSANPVAVAASPTRNEVYVLSAGLPGGQGSITVIDCEHNAVVAAIAVGRDPVSIDVDAKGKFAYVANRGSNSVSVVDLEARRTIAQIGAGEEPDAALLSPDGKTLLVANHGGNSVSVFDVESRRLRSVIEGCPGAQSPVILPDSSKAFVACSAGHQVMAIALARPDDPQVANGPMADKLETLMDVGRAPVHLALKPDGGEVFASNSLSDSVSEIYATTDEVGDTYMIGEDPVMGLVSRDNSLLYEANLNSPDVTVYSIDDGKRVGVVHVGDGPTAMAFSGAGHLLFVVDSRSDDVAVVRTTARSALATRSLFTMLPAGKNPNAIVVKAFRVK
ncbi:MAG TPA: beta-propeller fold lactonase family protein [Terracidiphilus sp.]|nr:beta-propeller fold lactonase family protein [Terracidiphilus sp.]